MIAQGVCTVDHDSARNNYRIRRRAEGKLGNLVNVLEDRQRLPGNIGHRAYPLGDARRADYVAMRIPTRLAKWRWSTTA